MKQLFTMLMLLCCTQLAQAQLNKIRFTNNTSEPDLFVYLEAKGSLPTPPCHSQSTTAALGPLNTGVTYTYDITGSLTWSPSLPVVAFNAFGLYTIPTGMPGTPVWHQYTCPAPAVFPPTPVRVFINGTGYWMSFATPVTGEVNVTIY